MHILVVPSEHLVTQKNPLAGIFQYEQARALAKVGHSVGIISTGTISVRNLLSGYPYKKNENFGNLQVIRCYEQALLPRRFLLPSWQKYLQIRLFKKSFLIYIEKYGLPDIVHAHNILFAGVIAKWIKEKYGIPFLLTEHSSIVGRNLISTSYNYLMKEVLKNADYLTCVSSSFATVLGKRFDVHFNVLHNIVDELFFHYPLKKRPHNNFIFLNAASLDQNKNHKILIEAFFLAFKNKSAKLNIAGEGGKKDELIKLTKLLGIESQVNFLGRLSRDELCKRMLESNCFVLSSNYETFGVVLIEALASGIPLIATRSGGPRDIVTEANGILVNVGAVEELSQAMKFMFINSESYDSNVLRAEAFNKFGEGSFVSCVENLYAQILNSKNN